LTAPVPGGKDIHWPSFGVTFAFLNVRNRPQRDIPRILVNFRVAATPDVHIQQSYTSNQQRMFKKTKFDSSMWTIDVAIE
jgi:hypothetical protein